MEDLGWEKNYKKINYKFSPCFGPRPTVCFFLRTLGPESGAKKMCVHVFVDDLSLFQATVTPHWQSEPSFGSIITRLLAKLDVA